MKYLQIKRHTDTQMYKDNLDTWHVLQINIEITKKTIS